MPGIKLALNRQPPQIDLRNYLSRAVGRDAGITILDLVEGDFTFTGTTGQAFRGGYGLVPVHTLRAGVSHSPHWGTHPWGWLPERP